MNLFYVKEHGFVNAGKLYIGDKLLDSNDSTLIVEDRKVETIDEPVKVYNFQVEDFHTYHVGNNTILVHNTCIRPKNGGVENPDGTTTYTKNIDGKEVSVKYNKEGYPDFPLMRKHFQMVTNRYKLSILVHAQKILD